MSSNKNYLFVCGVGRSGTTALCEVLNLHEKIVLGVERYKYLMIGKSFPERPTELFQKERFFDYRPEDTNYQIHSDRYRAVYENARRKFNTAIYFGDKTPGLYKKLNALKIGYPNCKVIYILRDPISVAYSWQNRADEGRESWPAENGYEASVLEWNRSLKIIDQATHDWGENLILVNYESTFGKQAHLVFPDLLDKLALGRCVNNDIREFLDKSIEVASRTRNVPLHIVEHVRNNANYDLYKRILDRMEYQSIEMPQPIPQLG